MGSRLDITCNILVVGLRRSWKCVLTDTISVSTATFNSPWPLADSTCNIKQELSLKKNYHWRRTITEEELSLKKNYHWRRWNSSTYLLLEHRTWTLVWMVFIIVYNTFGKKQLLHDCHYSVWVWTKSTIHWMQSCAHLL